VPRHPTWRELSVPFTGDGLETFCSRLGGFLCLPRFTWIDAGAELLAGAIALVAGSFSKSRQERPQSKPLLFCAKAIFPPPILATSRADLEVEFAAIKELEGLVLGFAERHFYVS
jgi:hypothetical protein